MEKEKQLEKGLSFLNAELDKQFLDEPLEFVARLILLELGADQDSIECIQITQLFYNYEKERITKDNLIKDISLNLVTSQLKGRK